MRKFIKLLTHYWFAYLITSVVLVPIFYIEADFVTALAGAVVFGLFFAVVPVFIAEFIDGLLPPEVSYKNPSLDSLFEQDQLAKKKLP